MDFLIFILWKNAIQTLIPYCQCDFTIRKRYENTCITSFFSRFYSDLTDVRANVRSTKQRISQRISCYYKSVNVRLRAMYNRYVHFGRIARILWRWIRANMTAIRNAMIIFTKLTINPLAARWKYRGAARFPISTATQLSFLFSNKCVRKFRREIFKDKMNSMIEMNNLIREKCVAWCFPKRISFTQQIQLAIFEMKSEWRIWIEIRAYLLMQIARYCNHIVIETCPLHDSRILWILHCKSKLFVLNILALSSLSNLALVSRNSKERLLWNWAYKRNARSRGRDDETLLNPTPWVSNR